MKRTAIAFLLAASLAAPAIAGTTEGTAAYKRGDFAAAHREFLSAARDGDARAQFSLGLMYLRGQGVAPDMRAASIWLRKAAGRGDGDARIVLGELHMRDIPGLRDFVKSHMWLTLALNKVRGPKRGMALDLRRQVAARMTPDQIARAQKLVADWRETER
jgi:TPR repeat protein